MLRVCFALLVSAACIYEACAAGPTCDNTTATIGENQATLVLLPCYDDDFDIDSVNILSAATNGSTYPPFSDVFGWATSYTPTEDFAGGDSFTYQATDAASANSSVATAALTIVPEPRGALRQLENGAGCIVSSASFGGCVGPVYGITRPIALVASPDGKQIYVADSDNHGVAVLNRDSTTGVLTQSADPGRCYSKTGDGNNDGFVSECLAFAPLDGVSSLAVSPDGKHLYAGTTTSAAIVIFNRNETTGLLSDPRCISATGSGGACTTGHATLSGRGMVIAPDGRFVYAAGGEALGVLSRNAESGDLTQAGGALGCISQTAGACTSVSLLPNSTHLALTAAGNQLLSASLEFLSGGVVVFNRSTDTGLLTESGHCANHDGTNGCTAAASLSEISGLTLSRDEAQLYVISSWGGLTVFQRRTDTGALSPDSCFNTDGSQGCTATFSIEGLTAIFVHPDDQTVYVHAGDTLPPATHAFHRAADGTLTRLADPFGCLAGTSGLCTLFTYSGTPRSLLVSEDGKFAYLGNAGSGWGTSNITIHSINRVPECSASAATVAHGQSVNVPLACADANDDTVVYSTVVSPTHGTLGTINQSAHTVAYTAAEDYTGSDSFSYRGSDGASGDAAAVTITVTNDIPVCANTGAQSSGSAAISVALPCLDGDSDPLLISTAALSGGSLGEVDQGAKTVLFSPPAPGSYSFTYSATDGLAASESATATVTVLEAGAEVTLSSPNSMLGCGPASGQACRIKRRRSVVWLGSIGSIEPLAGIAVTLVFEKRENRAWRTGFSRTTTVTPSNTFRVRIPATRSPLKRGVWRVKAVVASTVFTPETVSAYRYLRVR